MLLCFYHDCDEYTQFNFSSVFGLNFFCFFLIHFFFFNLLCKCIFEIDDMF
jgi:hypothetical protein